MIFPDKKIIFTQTTPDESNSARSATLSFPRLFIIFLLFITHCSLFITRAQQPTQEWVQRFTHGNLAFGLSDKLDSLGNVYVLVGTSIADSTNGDYCVLKYSNSGSLIWSAFYNSPGNLSDVPVAFDVTSQGDIYVTGYTQINSLDYITTVKFNSNGILQWARIYQGGWGNDEPTNLCLDKQGNVIVIGYSLVSVTLSRALTIKYSPAGDSLWVRKFSQLPFASNVFYSVADDSNNVYGTGLYGTNGWDYLTVKYNSIGNLLWYNTYDNPQHSDDVAAFVDVDNNMNVFVVGTNVVQSNLFNNTLLKINSAGTLQWSRIFVGIIGGQGHCVSPGGLVLMPDGNSIYYVTECSNGTGGGGYDIVTLKYDSVGDSIWVRTYGGGVDGTQNVASSLKLDRFGNCYIIGTGNYITSGDDYVTLKYLPNGIQQWVVTYNGPLSNSNDQASDAVIDSGLNVFVTGSSSRQNQPQALWDAATIKYSQPIGILNNSNSLPGKFSLNQNYPNPFNPITVIEYELPALSNVILNMYNITGQLVKSLVDARQNAGYYSVAVNLENLASGVYFYSLISNGSFIDTKKLVLIK